MRPLYSQSLTRERTIYSCEVFAKDLESGINQINGAALLRKTQSGIKNSETGDSSHDNSVSESGNKTLVIIRVCGSGFLYNMVRIIAGTLLDVGRGKNVPADIAGMLAAKDRGRAGATLEPQGLFLMGYERSSSLVN